MIVQGCTDHRVEGERHQVKLEAEAAEPRCDCTAALSLPIIDSVMFTHGAIDVDDDSGQHCEIIYV